MDSADSILISFSFLLKSVGKNVEDITFPLLGTFLSSEVLLAMLVASKACRNC